MLAILFGVGFAGVANRAGAAQIDAGSRVARLPAHWMRRQGADECESRDKQRDFRRGAEMRHPRVSWFSKIQMMPEHCSPQTKENLLEVVITPADARFR
jgi:hypothetical protein